jgi:hypothetical protein
MEKRLYETDNDYILDVLEDAANKSIDKIFDKIEGDARHEFSKLLAILDVLEEINDRKRA